MATIDGRARAVVTLVVVGLLWSTAGVLIKYVAWPPAAIWGLRSAIAATTLIAIYRPSWRGVTRTEWASAVALAATTGLFVLANKWTTAANAILIQYSAPAWAALLAAVLIGERASRIDWITIGLALVGVSLFFRDQLALDHVAGNFVALGAGVCFATNVVLLRKIARTPDGTSSALRAMILGHVVAAVLGGPFVLTAPALPASGWAAMAALGLLQQTAPTMLYAWAIRRVTAVEGLLIPMIEPIVSPLWVFLLFAERPGLWALVGGAVVVGAVTMRGLAPARG
ncbi:MAG: EamA family transporter [Myxococcales bacterium]|nr:EamA family transporter [Myxococcales bacterium]